VWHLKSAPAKLVGITDKAPGEAKIIARAIIEYEVPINEHGRGAAARLMPRNIGLSYNIAIYQAVDRIGRRVPNLVRDCRSAQWCFLTCS
jgi:hypothetical protein